MPQAVHGGFPITIEKMFHAGAIPIRLVVFVKLRFSDLAEKVFCVLFENASVHILAVIIVNRWFPRSLGEIFSEFAVSFRFFAKFGSNDPQLDLDIIRLEMREVAPYFGIRPARVFLQVVQSLSQVSKAPGKSLPSRFFSPWR